MVYVHIVNILKTLCFHNLIGWCLNKSFTKRQHCNNVKWWKLKTRVSTVSVAVSHHDIQVPNHTVHVLSSACLRFDSYRQWISYGQFVQMKGLKTHCLYMTQHLLVKPLMNFTAHIWTKPLFNDKLCVQRVLSARITGLTVDMCCHLAPHVLPPGATWNLLLPLLTYRSLRAYLSTFNWFCLRAGKKHF